MPVEEHITTDSAKPEQNNELIKNNNARIWQWKYSVTPYYQRFLVSRTKASPATYNSTPSRSSSNTLLISHSIKKWVVLMTTPGCIR
jgi:hypothetical protein